MRDSAQEIPMSQSSVAEEYCQTHGDLFVAFDKKKNELVCNQCIYTVKEVGSEESDAEQAESSPSGHTDRRFQSWSVRQVWPAEKGHFFLLYPAKMP